MKLGLERSRALVQAVGLRSGAARGALIAGTNGKGSTAALLQAILTARGLATGTLPSPHLSTYRERIQVDGVPISEADFAATMTRMAPVVARLAAALGEPTEFELLVAAALDYLLPRTRRLVVEVGLGGRLDSTNVLDLGVAVITNVALDHTRHLGSTIEAIAAEKAGIVKPGDAVVTGATAAALAVIESAAASAGAISLWRLGRELQMSCRRLGWQGLELDVAGPGFEHVGLRTPLLGAWQAENAALAVAAAHALGDATEEAVRLGLSAVRWPGRLERVHDRLLLDGGHNPEGLRRLREEVRTLVGEAPVTVVFGAMRDKDVPAMLAELALLEPVTVVFTAAASAGDRAEPAADLAVRWTESPATWEADAATALARARDLAAGGWILVCGSLYLVGELRPALVVPPARWSLVSPDS